MAFISPAGIPARPLGALASPSKQVLIRATPSRSHLSPLAVPDPPWRGRTWTRPRSLRFSFQTRNAHGADTSISRVAACRGGDNRRTESFSLADIILQSSMYCTRSFGEMLMMQGQGFVEIAGGFCDHARIHMCYLYFRD